MSNERRIIPINNSQITKRSNDLLQWHNGNDKNAKNNIYFSSIITTAVAVALTVTVAE